MSTTTRRPPRPAAPPPPRQSLRLTRDYDWRDDAACRGHDPELWFPVGDSGLARAQTAEAKRVCVGCPVRQECTEYALGTGQYTGVWGGTTEAERRGLLRGGDTSFLRCLEDQEYIEDRLARGVGRRALARELGVSYEILRRALVFFQAERTTAADEVAPQEVAAA
jgi:WhiB family redox-sensing transcriptional regulator